jgi:acyl-CoA reductase-like NAD-dependent aldehyde dehydrogenase
MDRVADTLASARPRPASSAASCSGRRLAPGIGNTALTYRAPAGVALAITPFNAPANLLAHKLGASFARRQHHHRQGAAAGARRVAGRRGPAARGRRPAEAVQLLHGGGEVGAALCALPEVGVVSFTGSAATGDAVARAAGAKRLVLELGGNAATIVCEDADIAGGAQVCARTGYSNSGQSCISVQRVYVHRSRYRRFVDAHGRGRGAGRRRPARPATDVGSMVDDAAAERVVAWAAEAVRAGRPITSAAPATGHPAPDRRWPTRRRRRRGRTRCSARWSRCCPTTTSTTCRGLQPPAGTGCRPGCSPATSAGSSPPGASSRWAASS